MRSLLDQLYQTKLQLIAVSSVAVGVAVLVLAHWSTRTNGPGWLTAVPLSELGSTIFGTGLLAVFFEYVDRKHGDQRTDQRVRHAVRQEAPGHPRRCPGRLRLQPCGTEGRSLTGNVGSHRRECARL